MGSVDNQPDTGKKYEESKENEAEAINRGVSLMIQCLHFLFQWKLRSEST